MGRRKLVVGNWKMNGRLADLDAVRAIDAVAAGQPAVEVGLCLPATLIAPAAAAAHALFVGAQDAHMAEKGAHTGCLSAAMLAEAGAGWAIVGHSERRADQGESDADVAAKAAAVHAAGLKAILCVGESLAARDAGGAEALVAAQLVASLPADAAADWLAIAYEPIWAIGTGRTPTTAQIADMHAALRAALADRLGRGAADAMRILYGGSVSGANAAEIFALPDVDGGLVGGASLRVDAFAPVIAAAAR